MERRDVGFADALSVARRSSAARRPWLASSRRRRAASRPEAAAARSAPASADAVRRSSTSDRGPRPCAPRASRARSRGGRRGERPRARGSWPRPSVPPAARRSRREPSRRAVTSASRADDLGERVRRGGGGRRGLGERGLGLFAGLHGAAGLLDEPAVIGFRFPALRLEELLARGGFLGLARGRGDGGLGGEERLSRARRARRPRSRTARSSSSARRRASRTLRLESGELRESRGLGVRRRLRGPPRPRRSRPCSRSARSRASFFFCPARTSACSFQRAAREACRFSEAHVRSISETMSVRRRRFPRVSSSFTSAWRLRILYFETPAASSMSRRRSCGFVERIRSIFCCSMIEYARTPRPVPRRISCTSLRRDLFPFRM